MENVNLNKNMCEKIFGGEMYFMEMPEGEISSAKKLRDYLHRIHKKDLGVLQKVQGVLRKSLSIRDGIGEALYQLKELRIGMLSWDNFVDHFVNSLKDWIVSRIKEEGYLKTMDVVDEGSFVNKDTLRMNYTSGRCQQATDRFVRLYC